MSVSLSHLVLSDAPKGPRKPSWLKMRMPEGEGYSKLKKLVDDNRLHTVCQSAKCPNIGECWSAGTATLMILGDAARGRAGSAISRPDARRRSTWMSRDAWAKRWR